MASHSHSDKHEHITSYKTYFIVWAVLMVLTVITFLLCIGTTPQPQIAVKNKKRAKTTSKQWMLENGANKAVVFTHLIMVIYYCGQNGLTQKIVQTIQDVKNMKINLGSLLQTG